MIHFLILLYKGGSLLVEWHYLVDSGSLSGKGGSQKRTKWLTLCGIFSKYKGNTYSNMKSLEFFIKNLLQQ